MEEKLQEKNAGESLPATEQFEERSGEAAEKKKEIFATADEYERMKLAQRLPLGIVMGLLAAAVCAALWAVISVATGYQIGYMAIAVGAAVGFTIRYFGRGVQPAFGVVGAVLALLSCMVGNFFSVMGFTAAEFGIPVTTMLSEFDYSYLPAVMGETFHVMDLLFYALAIWEGYKFSFRKVTITQ